MTPLIVAADTSAVFSIPPSVILSAGWFYSGDAMLRILSCIHPFCRYAPFDCKFSDFMLNAVTHNFIAAVDDINVC